MKNNIIKFPTPFKAKLIQNLKEIGYTPEQIEEALLFTENNSPDDDPPPPRPRKRMKKPEAEVIPFPQKSKTISIVRKAA